MSKGFNPNPKPDKVYLSIKTQIELLIKQSQSDEQSSAVGDHNLIPIFHTTKKRFAILKRVANDLAISTPNLNFTVLSDNEDRYCCVVTETNPGEKGFSYTWVEQSKISNKWLVMAQPPGATRFDSLTVWNSEADARRIALEIFNTIKNFPLNEWNKKHDSKYYRSFLRSLPPDDDSVVGIMTPQSIANFDIEAQNELKVYYDQVLNSEITKEEFYQKLTEIAQTQKNP
ncbi:hypothetical protein [Rivularia sp. UHCC 0363]|uniref:hypothetical protein n=1 Tax=Rivularia sp. UHCC 0363 TaxID=3110244 RepID=UPI002B210BC7|nr:hypothetical protein [Rivularia sp. UHCC 0363]MEA5595746.1 hypothetical protein [Rivularia sp. UHCC 0363]